MKIFWISRSRKDLYKITSENEDFLSELCRCVHPQIWRVGRTLGLARTPYSKIVCELRIRRRVVPPVRGEARPPAFGPLSRFGGGRTYIVIASSSREIPWCYVRRSSSFRGPHPNQPGVRAVSRGQKPAPDYSAQLYILSCLRSASTERHVEYLELSFLHNSELVCL